MTRKETISASGVVLEERTYNNLNQITDNDISVDGTPTESWSFEHDANGRMTKKERTGEVFVYEWDPDEPRLLQVLSGPTDDPGDLDPIVSYTYDSAGRMLTRDDGTDVTSFTWDGWTMVKETTGSTVTRYIAPQGQLHSFERGGQVYQVHSDEHNGSVRAITDSIGAVVAHYEFDAWGNQLSSSSPFSGGLAYGCFVGSLVQCPASPSLS